MKIYGHPMSTCTRKVLTVMAEKGQEPDMVLVDLMKGEHKQPDHMARHPFGVIPALEDDGFWLYESRAMIRYLDDKLEGTKLVPTDLKERAAMEQAISIEQSYFSSAAMKIVWNLMFKKAMMGQEPDMAAVEQGRAEVNRVLDITEKTLANQDYLGGKAFTLADITWMPYVQYLFASGEGALIDSRPNVAAWWKRVSTRPSWQKVAG